MKITLDSNLIPLLPQYKVEREREYFLRNFAPDKEKKKVVRHDFADDTYVHSNTLQYLSLCWKNHWGAVISPDIVWFDLLCEIALLIKSNPEKYRHLFSQSDEKQSITVLTDDPELIPIDLIIAQLGQLVPTDVDKFFPKFTTSTPKSIFANSVAFADCVSPYYEYFMYMCGIPSLTIRGNLEDWSLLTERWLEVSKLMNINMDENKWFNHVNSNLFTLIKLFTDELSENEQTEWLKYIFAFEVCGSGSQEEVIGWYSGFTRETPKIRYITNYPTHAAQIEYTNLTTDKKFTLSTGLFSSVLNDNVLIPDYNLVITEHERV